MPKIIEYNKIPDLLFLPAVMCRDIRLAHVIPINDRKDGEPDVVIKSPVSGLDETVFRRGFITKYRYVDGKKISLAAWRRNYTALVMAECQELMYAMYIPPDFQLRVESDTEPIIIEATNKGLFLICDSTTNGKINRDSPRVVIPRYFRKMFIMQGSIKKNIANCVEIQAYLNEKHGIMNGQGEEQTSQMDFGGMSFEDMMFGANPSSPEDNTEDLGFSNSEVGGDLFDEMVPSTFNESQENENDTIDMIDKHVEKADTNIKAKDTDKTEVDATVQNKDVIIKNVTASESIPEGKFKVIASVVHLEKIVGFILMDSYGNKAEFNKRQMINFAQSNKLTNASMRVKNGKEYLYGIGVRLSDLPSINRD